MQMNFRLTSLQPISINLHFDFLLLSTSTHNYHQFTSLFAFQNRLKERISSEIELHTLVGKV